MYLFFFRLTILVALISGMRVYADTVSTSDYSQALAGCHDLGDTTEEYTLSPTSTILIAADPDPKGYCLIGLRNADTTVNESSSTGDATETPPSQKVPEGLKAGGQFSQPIPPHMCPLSKSDVDKLLSPEMANKFTNFVPGTPMSPDFMTALGNIMTCLNQPTHTTPTPVIPPTPPGVPGGTPLPLPAGVVAAPGTTPPGTPPGTILTPAAPGETNSNVMPANTTNQSK